MSSAELNNALNGFAEVGTAAQAAAYMRRNTLIAKAWGKVFVVTALFTVAVTLYKNNREDQNESHPFTRGLQVLGALPTALSFIYLAFNLFSIAAFKYQQARAEGAVDLGRRVIKQLS